MEQANSEAAHQELPRRQRLHELLLALIQQQQDFELMDSEEPRLERGAGLMDVQDPARWLERNRRLLKRYQALVRTAVTLDALLDAEQTTPPPG